MLVGWLPYCLSISGEQPLLLVLSALGKTTNALEVIVNLACSGNKEEALSATKKLEQQHLDYAKALLNQATYATAVTELKRYFAELEHGLETVDPTRYDYSYDQIVCMGEIFSSRIFAFYLQQNNVASDWVDIRTIIRTDHTYRDAVVDIEYSKLHAKAIIGNQLEQGKIVVTQGFIGSTQKVNR